MSGKYQRTETVIRDVTAEDAGELLAIYAPYVEKTAISFETAVPSAEEFRRRIQETVRRYPYLAAEAGGEIIGYCYAGSFKGRAAYDWSCETTVYTREDVRRQGTGRLLYDQLEVRLRSMGIRNMYACIAYPKEEDEYLDYTSVRFHAGMGFAECGRFHDCASKFGRWYDMIWMEKHIMDHPDGPPGVMFREETV